MKNNKEFISKRTDEICNQIKEGYKAKSKHQEMVLQMDLQMYAANRAMHEYMAEIVTREGSTYYDKKTGLSKTRPEFDAMIQADVDACKNLENLEYFRI